MGLLTAWMVDDGHDLLQTLYFAGVVASSPCTTCHPLRH